MTEKKEPLLTEQRNNLFLVDPRAIDIIDGFNVRIDYGNLDELADSIQQNGVKVPLRGRRNPDKEGRFLLTDGHRRHQACMNLISAGRLTELRIPFRLEPQKYSDEQRVADMLITNDSKPLTIIEQSEAINRLSSYGLSEKEIAGKIGKSSSLVRNCLLLHSAPKNIKNLITNKIISPTLVIELMKTEKYDDAIKTISSLCKEPEVSPPGLSEKTESKPVRITRKKVMNKKGKFNSVSYFKKASKLQQTMKIRDDKKDLFEFVKNLLAGKYDRQEIEQIFFEPMMDFEPMADN